MNKVIDEEKNKRLTKRRKSLIRNHKELL